MEEQATTSHPTSSRMVGQATTCYPTSSRTVGQATTCHHTRTLMVEQATHLSPHQFTGSWAQRQSFSASQTQSFVYADNLKNEKSRVNGLIDTRLAKTCLVLLREAVQFWWDMDCRSYLRLICVCVVWVIREPQFYKTNEYIICSLVLLLLIFLLSGNRSCNWLCYLFSVNP